MCKNLHAEWPCTYNWNASDQDLLLVTELPTLERRRLDLKLGQLFKIVHKRCYFPVKLREQSTLLSNINQEHIQILFSSHLCLIHACNYNIHELYSYIISLSVTLFSLSCISIYYSYFGSTFSVSHANA